MLLKALKFMTLIHRQIECSQWDHQQFPGKKYFSKKFNCAKNFTICVAETEIMRNKKMERKNCLFKVEMKIWATAKRQKRASSADEAPLSNWKLTSVDQWSHIRSDFDLITQLSSDHTSDFDLITHPTLIWSDIQVSHKREHHTQNEPFCDHVNLFYILDPHLNLRKRKLAFKWPLSVSKHAEQILFRIIGDFSFCGCF